MNEGLLYLCYALVAGAVIWPMVQLLLEDARRRRYERETIARRLAERRPMARP